MKFWPFGKRTDVKDRPVCPFCSEDVLAGGAHAYMEEGEFRRCHTVCFISQRDPDE